MLFSLCAGCLWRAGRSIHRQHDLALNVSRSTSVSRGGSLVRETASSTPAAERAIVYQSRATTQYLAGDDAPRAAPEHGVSIR